MATTTTGLACVACGATSQTVTTGHAPRVYETRPMADGGTPVCYVCYYSGQGFAHIYSAVIDHCRAYGVELCVWQTGGGCQNFGVAFPEGHYVAEALFGNLNGNLATDEFGGDVYTYYDIGQSDYDDELSLVMRLKFPPPEVQTVESVARWIVDCVTYLRGLTGGDV